ncbi:hypothetical protein HOH87_03005 [bacterium]|jgi:hypothetical protein|nr:hypothetical protein [bacterium]
MSTPGTNTQLNHDTSEPHISNILLSVAVFLVGMIIIGIISVFLFRGAVSSELIQKNSTGLSLERQQLAATEDEALNDTQWIDKTTGTVQVPISVAMDLVIQDYR